MTTAVRANLWVCTTSAERDALRTVDGVKSGDIAIVSGTGLYRTIAVTGAGSSWQVLAGLPVQGVWAMGGRNHAPGPGQARVFARVGIDFHSPLLAAPASISLVVGSSSGWSTAPTVVYADANGFVLEGDSDLVNSGLTAWTMGTFTANP